jgi:predicted AlkP superfamily pyrophosphatase or phosphodiesterase
MLRSLCAAALLLASRLALAAEPTVILLSFDGTRPADVAARPSFARIAAAGAVAERLVPVFPSNTFPNHVTFATGVSPDRHGIVNNAFLDPTRGRYDYTADPTWLEVEPIWSLAARAGVVSASFHWVGSEGTWRSGLGPRHWKPFDTTVGERTKVEQILAWLDLPDPAERPRLVTAWFHGADGAAHRYGPDSPEVEAALARQDADLGALLDGLAARGLDASTTLLVVSDHGMTSTRRIVDFAAEVAALRVGARVIGGGGFAQVALRGDADRPARAERVVALARALGLEAWRRGAGPPEYPIANPRFGDVVVVAPLGTAIAPQSTWAWLLSLVGQLRVAMRGVHGHRPELPEMAGLFTAVGRGVAPGVQLGTVRAVDVAPTVLALLALPIPEWMEGRPISLDAGTPAPGAAH